MSVGLVNNTDYSTLYKTGNSSQSSSDTQKPDELGKEAFLNLLITQLKNQDPLEPLKDTDFIAQLATFSNLEQMSTMSDTMSALTKQQGILNATSLIGKEVTTLSGFKGVVSGVGMEEDKTVLYSGDTKISIDDISAINNPTA